MIDPLDVFCNENGLTPDELVAAYMKPAAEAAAKMVEDDLLTLYAEFVKDHSIK